VAVPFVRCAGAAYLCGYSVHPLISRGAGHAFKGRKIAVRHKDFRSAEDRHARQRLPRDADEIEVLGLAACRELYRLRISPRTSLGLSTAACHGWEPCIVLSGTDGLMTPSADRCYRPFTPSQFFSEAVLECARGESGWLLVGRLFSEHPVPPPWR
jgi:hypothetical protein